MPATLAPQYETTIATLLHRLAHRLRAGEITNLNELIEWLGDRSFGLGLLALVIPTLFPLSAIPGVAMLFSIPMLLLTLQLIIGRQQVWLPDKLGRKNLPRQRFASLLDKAAPWIRKLEGKSSQRLAALTTDRAERWMGALLSLLALALMMPIPLSNFPLSAAIFCFAMGFIKKDGVWILFGIILSILLLGGLGWGIINGVQLLNG